MAVFPKLPRSQQLVGILLVGALSVLLLLVAFVPLVIESRAVSQLEREQQIATRQAATVLSNRLGEVQRRLEWAELSKETPQLLRDLERPWDEKFGIFLFVHDQNGRILAVDRRVAPEMSKHFERHIHAPEPANSSVHVCEKCLEDMHAVGASVRRPDGTRLVASIDAEKLADGALSEMLGATGGAASLRHGERKIFSVGDVGDGHELRSTANVPGTPWRIEVATPEALTTGLRRDIAFLCGLGALVCFLLVLSAVAHHRSRREIDEERARVADELVGQARLATLGLLSASVSHEINNALHIAMTYSGAAREAANSDEREEFLTAIDEALGNIETISRDTLGFARSDSDSTRFELTQAVEEALRVVSPRLKYVELDVELAEAGTIEGSPGSIAQVVVNLLLNAAQAMENNPGTIRVRTGRQGDCLVLAVTDDGPGIDADILPELFTPLATTKENGTGLGLWLSRQIIKQHGGTIRAENRPGAGARFVIELPIVSAENRKAA